MKTLYAAPMNLYSTPLYRHFLLYYGGADYVFTELLMVEQLATDDRFEKIRILDTSEYPKTIFQIGAATVDEVRQGIDYLTSYHDDICEINLNMGCPHSTMIRKGVCGGLLLLPEHISNVASTLVDYCKQKNILPSVKLRLGSDPETILIDTYLQRLFSVGIRKVYIHARTLKMNYGKPAFFEPLKTLKQKFPEMEIILNGDIDSFTTAQHLLDRIPCDGLMIGRASLNNPYIFNQIKQEVPERTATYDPIENDPYLTKEQGLIFMTEEKKQMLIDFFQLAQSYDYTIIEIYPSVRYLLQGISNNKQFLKQLREIESYDDLFASLSLLPVK